MDKKKRSTGLGPKTLFRRNETELQGAERLASYILTGDSYPEHIENSHNSTVKKKWSQD